LFANPSRGVNLRAWVDLCRGVNVRLVVHGSSQLDTQSVGSRGRHERQTEPLSKA
jgi:hypothetical protein